MALASERTNLEKHVSALILTSPSPSRLSCECLLLHFMRFLVIVLLPLLTCLESHFHSLFSLLFLPSFHSVLKVTVILSVGSQVNEFCCLFVSTANALMLDVYFIQVPVE